MTRKTRTGSYQNHVIDILAHGNMSTCPLESFLEKRMQQIHRMPTSRRHTMSGSHRFTDCTL
eukprot:49900-Amphidinium_carterae.1